MLRRHDLDWVRVCAFGLLVLYHVGMYYVSWDWHVKSPAASSALEPLMLLSSPWRMSLLFLVSGVATAFLLRKSKKQGRPFLGPRTGRLLLPLLFGMYVVVPPQAYYELIENLPGGYRVGYATFMGTYLRGGDFYCAAPGDCVDAPTWNHLWFLAYLWVYTVALAISAWVLPVRWRDALDRATQQALSGWGALLLPIAWLALARIALVARFESTHDLVDDWYNHAQYLPVFLLGFACARQNGFWEALERLRWVALIGAMLSYGFIVWYFYGTGYSDEAPPPDALRMLQRGLWAVNQWATIAAICGFAYRLRARDSATLRYLTPAVFPIYILHQTLIVVFAHELQRFRIAPLIEGPLLVLLTFALCFAGYEAICRIRWLRPLFGLPVDTARSNSNANRSAGITSGERTIQAATR